MASFNDGIEAAREKLHQRLADIGGCLDGNCMVVRPKGVHTNGGCQCLKNWTKAQQVVNAYKAFEAEVSTLKRPEPSEADTQKIGEAMREAVRNVCKGPTLSDELTDGQYAALFRAALKAMEGDQ